MAAISLGTALAIGAIGSAAGGATKAVMQSKAAKKAAQQQAQGAQEASRYMRQGLGNLSQLYQPYINSGAGAIGTLGRLTTPGPGARFASYGPPNAMPQPPAGNMAEDRYGLPGQGGGPPGGGRRPQGPYYMADGGDVVVDQPTMFIAGEAGPERATFQRPQMGMDTMGGGSDAIKAAILNKYGGGMRATPMRPFGGGGQPIDPRDLTRMAGAGMAAFRRPQAPPPMGPPGGMAPGMGGPFSQMGGARAMRRPMPPQPMAGPVGPGGPLY